MRAAPARPCQRGPPPGPVPSMIPPDCLVSAFPPGSRGVEAVALAPGIGMGGTGHPLSSVCVSPAMLQRFRRTAECQGSPEHPCLKIQASSECVAVCIFRLPPSRTTPPPPLVPGEELGAGVRPSPIICSPITSERLLSLVCNIDHGNCGRGGLGRMGCYINIDIILFSEVGWCYLMVVVGGVTGR